MKTIQLTLLGIMVVLAASLRAQTQQRNWPIFQPLDNMINVRTSDVNISISNHFPSVVFPDNLQRELWGSDYNTTSTTGLIGHFATNSIYNENGQSILHVVSSIINENPNNVNGTRKDLLLFDNEGKIIHTSNNIDGFTWNCSYSNEIPIVNIGCNKFHIITGYYLSELNLNSNNNQPTFGSQTYNLITETYGKAGLTIESTFRASYAVKKLSNGDYYLYMYYFNKPGHDNIGFKVFRFNSHTGLITKIQEEELFYSSQHSLNRVRGRHYLAEIEVSPDGTKIAYADANFVYVREILNDNTINFYEIYDFVKFHDQVVGDINAHPYEIAGLEFNATSQTLYYSVFHMSDNNAAINGIYRFNIGPNNHVVDIYPNSKSYGRSQIELARNGKLYIQSPNSIAAINDDLTVTDQLTGLTLPLTIRTHNISVFDNRIRTLPDQIDGYNYDQEYQNNRSLCCTAIHKVESRNFIINSNQSWSNTSNPIGSTTIQIRDHLIVKKGVRLNLTGLIIKFCEGAKMIIEDGAFVYTINTQFTSVDCNKLWSGIEVWGNPLTSQYPDATGKMTCGMLQLTGNSSVSNAEVAVRLSKAGTISHNAGILFATNTTFKNNVSAVEFNIYYYTEPGATKRKPYRNLIKECTFINDNLINASTPFKHFIKLRDVTGVRIQGCNFINDFTHTTNTKGIGIDAIDAGFTVTTNDPRFGVDPNTSVKSTFTGLEYAIRAGISHTNETYTVEYANFEQCFRGITNLGVNYAKIMRNKFTQDKNNPLHPDLILAGWHDNNPRGINIHIVTGTGYRIEENEYTELNHVGNYPWSNDIVDNIVVENSGPTNNMVYKNNCEYAYITGKANGVNRTDRYPFFYLGTEYAIASIHTGLRFLCNYSNNTNQTDFEIGNNTPASTIPWSLIGIAQHQANLTTSSILSAGNTFRTFSDNPNVTDYHFRYSAPTTIHYYWDASQYGKPEYITAGHVLPTPNTYGKACPTSIDLQNNGIPSSPLDGQFRNDLLISWRGKRDIFEKTADTLMTLLDNGSTTQLLSQLHTATTDALRNALYAQLLSTSPYLSNTFLTALVKSNTYSNDQLMNVLLLNPDATQDYELLTYLYEQKPIPFTLEQIDSIRNTWSETTTRTALSLRADMWLATSDRLATLLISNIMNDTTDEYQYMIDSIHNTQKSNEQVFSSIHNSIAQNQHAAIPTILNEAKTKYDKEPYAKTAFNTYTPLVEVMQQIHTSDTTFSFADLANHLPAIVDVAYATELWPSVVAANLYYKITDSILPAQQQFGKQSNKQFETTIPMNFKQRVRHEELNLTRSKEALFIYTDADKLTHIQLNKNQSVDGYAIYDLTGKLVLQNTKKSEANEIKVTLAPGNYIFVGNTAHKTLTKKFHVPFE
jgi:hypothetical protein